MLIPRQQATHYPQIATYLSVSGGGWPAMARRAYVPGPTHLGSLSIAGVETQYLHPDSPTTTGLSPAQVGRIVRYPRYLYFYGLDGTVLDLESAYANRSTYSMRAINIRPGGLANQLPTFSVSYFGSVDPFSEDAGYGLDNVYPLVMIPSGFGTFIPFADFDGGDLYFASLCCTLPCIVDAQSQTWGLGGSQQPWNDNYAPGLQVFDSSTAHTQNGDDNYMQRVQFLKSTTVGARTLAAVQPVIDRYRRFHMSFLINGDLTYDNRVYPDDFGTVVISPGALMSVPATQVMSEFFGSHPSFSVIQSSPAAATSLAISLADAFFS